MQRKFNHFISEYNIIQARPHVFRACQDIHTTIATTHYETTANSLADKQQGYAVLRDVAKAFGKVCHNGLKHKFLRSRKSNILDKFSYNRKARIIIGKENNNKIELKVAYHRKVFFSLTRNSLYTND